VYLQFFGLTEAPFAITPDPAFVYLSAAHRDALAHLLYGVGTGGAGGFVQLTGEVGTGKTTICRCLLEQVPEDTIIALILNPMLTPIELLATICEELGVSVAGIENSRKALVDALNAYLLEQHALGKRVVVVIDEAQNLSPEALEQVRLLTNLETAKEKLLQMILLGQPELRQLLQRQNLRQLAQRITARYHLLPLGDKETAAYVRHRMQVAGAHQSPFNRAALRSLYKRSGGVPRLINIIADRALVGAYARESNTVSARLVNSAADEVQPSETRVQKNIWPGVIAVVSVILLAGVSFLIWGLPQLASRAETKADPSLQISAKQTAVQVKESEVIQGESERAQQIPDNQPMGTVLSEQEPSAPVTPGLDESATILSKELLSLSMDTAWLNKQHSLAWQGMADLWQDPDNAIAIQAACDGQKGTGYACLRDHGSLARVRKLGLPVMLVLQEQGGRNVLLRGLVNNNLLLGAGRSPVEFLREVVEPLWLGEFLVIWPQAPDWPLQIRRGESGAAVDIVMSLAGQAEPAWQGNGIFDAGFESWLTEFQRNNSLRADGIIGPKTLLYLMAPTITEPRLVVASENRS
jgi:general secretion pathway protein A